jgi:hypothetical protein
MIFVKQNYIKMVIKILNFYKDIISNFKTAKKESLIKKVKL